MENGPFVIVFTLVTLQNKRRLRKVAASNYDVTSKLQYMSRVGGNM